MHYSSALENNRLSDRRRRILQFLRTNPTAVLCTITAENRPHGSVIYFYVDDNLTLYFITRARTLKHQNLILCNLVMLIVYGENSQTTVQVIGSAQKIANSGEVNEIAAKVLKASEVASHRSIMPIAKLDAGPFVAYSIQPDQIRWANYANPESDTASGPILESFESFDLYD